MRASARQERLIHSGDHLRSHFISSAGNRYASMHYDVTRVNTRMVLQELNTASEYATSGAAPAGVEQRNRALFGGNQVNRDAVGHGDEEERTGSGGSVAISPVDDGPPFGQRGVPEHAIAVNLMGDDRPRALRQRRAEPAPAFQHRPDRLRGPEAEVEGLVGVASSSGDPRDDAEAFPPPRNLPQRHGARYRDLVSRRHARSVRRARAGGCRSARSRARSGRCC